MTSNSKGPNGIDTPQANFGTNHFQNNGGDSKIDKMLHLIQ